MKHLQATDRDRRYERLVSIVPAYSSQQCCEYYKHTKPKSQPTWLINHSFNVFIKLILIRPSIFLPIYLSIYQTVLKIHTSFIDVE